MLEVFADKYIQLGRLFATLEMASPNVTLQSMKEIKQVPLEEEDIKRVQRVLVQCEELAEPLGLRFVLQQLSRLEAQFIIERHPTYGDMHNAAKEISNRFFDVFDSVSFLWLDKAQKKLYDQNPIEQIVLVEIPEIEYDITQALRCLALECYTASVFHCMRVMELSVQKLGKILGCEPQLKKAIEESEWQPILDAINRQIEFLYPKNSPVALTSQQRENKVLACGLADHLFNVKVAWRNEVMHPKEKYEADAIPLDIYSNTQKFVRFFAENLKNLP